MVTGDSAMATGTTMSRMEKRKLLKKEKRKQLRKEIALKEKEEEDARLNDTEEQTKLKKLELEELDRMERDRREFEERERNFLEELELKRKREQEEYEQEQVRQKLAQESRAKQAQEENSKEMDEGSDWEYVEEGPAEIIWQGNEIIVKKKRVKVPKKKNSEQQNKKEDVVRPISNPLAPQSEVFEEYKSAKEVLDSVAQQVPNFGTEQDKDHCPFHLKTGACRFGPRCSRVHFYPDKSCTLLMKNMYGGPGLVWEQDEGLEHTDEEIQKSFEEFYEDVHTEFLKFGEIVNFKVCRNGSPHLRGNVYVHYKSIESAVLAYQSTNGRYFAAKQVICEFVNLTRWKVAICGEYMKSRLKRCSRGSACNFIHCFRNPGGDYEWADWDRPPPRYWITKLAALFGYEDEYENLINEVNPDEGRISTSIRMDADRHHSRSRSRDPGSRNTRSYDDNDYRKSKEKQSRYIRKGRETSLDRGKNKEKMRGKDKSVYSDDDQSDRESRRINHEGYYAHKRSHRRSRWRSKDRCSESNSDRDDNSAKDLRERYREEYKSHRSGRHSYGKSAESDSDGERSIKDGRKRYREDKAEETHQNNSEGRYHEYRRKSSKHEVSDLDTSSSDSHGDTVVKNKDSFDKYENDYYRQRKESSNPETVIKRTELSEHTSSRSRRNKDEKRESSKHRKGEKSHHKSKRRSSRHRNDQNKVDVQVVTEMHNAEKHVRFEAAESDEGNGHLSRQDDSVELEIENEEACRRVALEKLQEKQLQKQLSMKSSNCNVEESVTTTKVNEDQNDIEAEPGKRRRI